MILPYTYAAGRLAEEKMENTARERPHPRSIRRARSARQNFRARTITYLSSLGVLSSSKLLKEMSPT
jgi:hypothetical protein